ncbi:hypothetical protein [Hymenobacter cellulosivorans]|uniref:Uncharacterized protein n=1 Tax=Hymenobacter cellulosivorans TaxID=2932249 RepID=A0ABY4F3E6_9BACT|nr:hypothetical protein [Hymenobacter cellulosivorans]UOQ51004.1 hypothetical protein MUN80_14685 [Hymenobacter cellulosivorans]
MKKVLFYARALPMRAAAVAWRLFRLHLGLSMAIGWSKLVSLYTATEAAKLTAVGRYFPEYWLNRFAQPVPRPWAVAAAAFTILLLLTTGQAPAQNPPEPLTWLQLQRLAQPWHGTLTYLDYRSQQPVTLPTKLVGRASAAGQLTLDFIYQEPSGRQVTGADQVELSADGRTLTWDAVVLRINQNAVSPNQDWLLVLEGEGQDDGKACLVRKTVLLCAGQLSVNKEVRYARVPTFVTRNTYFFSK